MAEGTSEKQLNKTLECSICVEVFTDPRVLPCQHTFCLGCLQDYVGDAQRINCPMCKEQCQIPEEGVTGLKPNIMIKGVIDVVSPSVMQTEVPCHSCEKKGLEMVSHCDDCEGNICISCSDAHQAMKIYKSHKVKAIVTVSMETARARHLNKEKMEVKRKIQQKFIHLQPKIPKLSGAINQMDQFFSQISSERDEILARIDNNHQKLLAEIQTYVNEVKSEVNANAVHRLGIITKCKALEKHKQSLQQYKDLRKQNEELNAEGAGSESYREVLSGLKLVQEDGIPNPLQLLMPAKSFIDGDLESVGGYQSYAKHGIGFLYKDSSERVVSVDEDGTDAPTPLKDRTVEFIHEAMNRYGKYPRNLQTLGNIAKYIRRKYNPEYDRNECVVFVELLKCNIFEANVRNRISVLCDQMHIEVFEIRF